ncbi:unnamed protein product [Ectocarpus sp. 12 AP-2014]
MWFDIFLAEKSTDGARVVGRLTGEEKLGEGLVGFFTLARGWGVPPDAIIAAGTYTHVYLLLRVAHHRFSPLLLVFVLLFFSISVISVILLSSLFLMYRVRRLSLRYDRPCIYWLFENCAFFITHILLVL